METFKGVEGHTKTSRRIDEISTTDHAERPARTVPSPLQRLHQEIGNRAVGRLLRSGVIQTELKSGTPGDKYEREADRVANAVIRMPAPVTPQRPPAGMSIQPTQAAPNTETVQREVEENDPSQKEPLPISRVLAQPPDGPSDLEKGLQGLQGGGRPLPGSVRTFFEPRFGRNFSQVRVHTGTHATSTARAMHARAFTIGRDIVFESGEYAPGTTKGNRLLAHELTHVVQQDMGRGGRARPQLEEREGEPEPQPSLPRPPYGVTFDLLDPLNSSLRIGGFSIPSIRSIMNGLEAIRGLGRPRLDPPNVVWPPTQLSNEELRRAACRVLPSLCTGTFTPLPSPERLRLSLPLRFRMPRLTQVAFHHVDHFIYGSSAIPDRHRGLLDRTATDMHDHPNYLTSLVGHTDTHGGPTSNQRLSERRAQAVSQYLTNRSVPADQITSVRGVGETQPRFLDDRTNWLSAARNRRVDVTIKQLVWEASLVPRLRLRGPAPAAAQINDPRVAVLPAERPRFVDLRTFLRNTTRRIRALVARGPAGEPWLRSDNENITSLLALLDQLIADLNAERLIIRFDQPVAGSKAASYTSTEDVVHLRPFTNNVQRADVAAGLIHEYTHVIQDRTMENLLRASRGPLEHTREAELRQEIEARRQGSYFIRLLLQLGMNLGDPLGRELTARVYVGRFERERTGSPTQQAAARQEIRSTLRSAYADQLRQNAPSRMYLIRVDDSNRARLETGAATAVDLGEIPATVTNRAALTSHLQTAVSSLSGFAGLFAGPRGVRYNFVLFFAFHRNRKLAEFGLQRPGLGP